MRTKGVLLDTDAEIRRRIAYEHDTGIFFWKVTIGGRGAKAGSEMTGRVNHSGYRDIGVNGKRYLLHRVAWFLIHGEWPLNIDHIDHNRLNNKLSNLRSVSNADNMCNKSLSPRNKSGVTGIDWYKRDNKWRVQISKDRKHIWIGYFDDLFDAISARKSAERLYGFHENHGKRIAT